MVTKQLKPYLGEHIWQKNYYEHIIRNDKSYDDIVSYIINNPYNWEFDKLFIIKE